MLTPTQIPDIMNELDEILQPRDAYEVDDNDDEDMGEDNGGPSMDYGGSEDGFHLQAEGATMEDDAADDDALFNPIAMGLKEINGLAHFRVSSYKPGNGIEELMHDDIDRYWQ